MGRTARLPIDQLRRLFLDVPHPRTPPAVHAAAVARLAPGPFDWSALFGNARPVEIEVGCGKGLFLLNEARRRPATNFLGIEIENKYVLFAANRLAARGVENVRLACTDAKWLLREKVAADSVAAVHVYFPDPWWKKRHKKRMLFTPDFAAEIARVLKPGGTLHFASDVQEYFDGTLAILAELGQWQALPAPPPSEARDEADYLTNFERKFRKEGRPIYRSLHVKAAS